MIIIIRLSCFYLYKFQAFADHQAKVMETTQRIKVSRGQIESLKLECVKSQVAEKELKSLPGEIRLYESLGRL